ncbi:sugar phosphate isomerase/epimerase and 4-hydroxyphenylpyruvate domain-containing protein [Nonomuraea sp. MG754425]|uniref:bifunctional sugar phosphate isomerase/epimerase/4-hydroxyphenylpyruvate dioxygenase family protein n=1 Tax=Nonomuraea sp. MG754425 TaxID=2570319 RepID=UPI001F1D92AE|nr:sugar phosphate isomerase/epimerase and 4-hydroxyphenylpyruvate domain-containing protein [Nonomuraea sp. MG754425]MCF6473830.1 sugar phosphate isomerase/epimerase and 4-hydroxyphenylpyruvate domain-containing protein [Nonomuraea sp. MG754425]
MRKSIATVSVSGTLTEKLEAVAAAGFDGVEIFENDLLACPLPPEEIRARAAGLGLGIDLYQPFRDFESVTPDVLARNLRRAEHKFRVMRRLGADLLLVCSNVSPGVVGDDELAAEQLRLLADRAAEHGIRIAYEALAWGRHVNEYLHAWRVVRMADHPNLGTCLDSFHILSRGSDPIGIEAIPGEKIFFLQLADAPLLAMDVLQWSRHHRCFPGQGNFDVAGLVRHALNAGYTGPLSLEVFNDHFRQAVTGRTARDGMRSLLALEGELERAAHPSVPTGFAFAELSGPGPLRGVLAALGFARTGTHPTKPVELWSQGGARLLLNEGPPGTDPALVAIGLDSPHPGGAVKHAESLLSPVLPRERAPEDAPLDAVAAPDGTEIFFCDDGWLADFGGPGAPVAGEVTRIDHVALTQPPHYFDEAELFYRSVLGLSPQESLDLPDPYGLLRSKAMSAPDGSVRMVVNVAQVGAGHHPWQHVALACEDVVAVARRLRARQPGLLLPIPGNYYDDLEARHEIDPELRELGVLYDRDGDGEFLHLYTVTVGRVFFEFVQRIGGYQGYGAGNAPIRLAVQHVSPARGA